LKLLSTAVSSFYSLIKVSDADFSIRNR